MRYLALVVVQALIQALGNAGALYSTGAASSALTVGNRFSRSFCLRALGRAVPNEYARAGRRGIDGGAS